MKTDGRVLKRRLKVSGLTVHWQAYREHQKAHANYLTDVRSQFYSNIINNSHGNSKQHFSTINHILKPQTYSHSEATEERCNNFITFFRQKVDTIRSLLSSSPFLPVPTVYHYLGPSNLSVVFLTSLNERLRASSERWNHPPVPWTLFPQLW